MVETARFELASKDISVKTATEETEPQAFSDKKLVIFLPDYTIL